MPVHTLPCRPPCSRCRRMLMPLLSYLRFSLVRRRFSVRHELTPYVRRVAGQTRRRLGYDKCFLLLLAAAAFLMRVVLTMLRFAGTSEGTHCCMLSRRLVYVAFHTLFTLKR